MNRDVLVEELVRHLERTNGSIFVALVRELAAEAEKLARRQEADRIRSKNRRPPSRDASRDNGGSSRDGPPPARPANGAGHVTTPPKSRERHVTKSPQTPLSDQKDLSSSDTYADLKTGEEEAASRDASRDTKVSGTAARDALRAALKRAKDPREMNIGSAVQAYADVEKLAAGMASRKRKTLLEVLAVLAGGFVAERREKNKPIGNPDWFREWVAARVAEDQLSGDDEDLDEYGNPVFREIDGESTEARRLRLAAHNRKIREALG